MVVAYAIHQRVVVQTITHSPQMCEFLNTMIDQDDKGIWIY